MTKPTKLSAEKLTEKWKERDLGPFKLVKVDAVNFKPHPFTIGSAHVAHASRHCGGILGLETMETIPCAHCRAPLSAHTYDTVMMVKLTKTITKAEAQAALKAVCDEVEADGIDGFTFIETPEKYRIV